MAYVNFNRTKPASFALSEYADRNTIYFTTDTHEVIVNGQSFGGAVDLTELYKLINDLGVTHAEEAEVIAAALNDLNKRLVLGLASLNNIIIENELTTSASLNDLNTRLLDTIDTITIDAMFL